MPGKNNFGTYLKAAFRNRWNYLFLAGSFVAAMLTGHPDVFLALLAAAELALLTLVSSNPRFQRNIDAQNNASTERESEQALGRRFTQLLYGLGVPAQKRFEALRTRCEALRDLTVARNADDANANIDKISDSQLQGVNKLLWVYLKLLHTHTTLEQFFKSIDENEIVRLEEAARARLDQLPKESTDGINEKKRRSLEDTLATATARRENLKRARENHEYVELELERIAAKLTALSELAVNRQDPALITNEVDDVARSVEGTEQAIGELQQYTGLTQDDLQAPAILTARPQRVRV